VLGQTGADRMTHRKVVWAVVGALIGILLVASTLLIIPSLSSRGSTPPTPGFPVVPASFGGTNGSVVSLANGFLGVNVRAQANFTEAMASELNSSGARLIRWPGGELGDRFDPLSNDDAGSIYSDEGVPSAPGTTYAQFVALCRAISCESIVTLPAEIDNASEARAIVTYSESSLGFRPSFWEVGNEPALWQHFGIPWSKWNVSQEAAPTPSEYAAVVQSYVSAIRSVDTSTPIIGLGGIGKGASEVSEWFAPTLALNGPNLSAMAIHVYPAGSGLPVSNLSAWFATLWGSSGLPGRVLAATSVARSACPHCSVTILVDEFQIGTGLTADDSLGGGARASFVAAEIVESLPLPIASLDYYDFQSGGPGAWFGPTNGPSATYAMFEGFADYLGSHAIQLNVSSTASGVLAAEGGANLTTMSNLVVVNANATVGVRLNLSDQFPEAAQADAWYFNGTSSSPTVGTVSASAASNWTVPPASIAIFRGVGPIRSTSQVKATLASHDSVGGSKVVARSMFRVASPPSGAPPRNVWYATRYRGPDVRIP